MSQQTIYLNPFRQWAELLRGLRQRFTTEAGLVDNAALLTPPVGEFLGTLAGLINDCDKAAEMADALRGKNLEAFEAFHRSLE